MQIGWMAIMLVGSENGSELGACVERSAPMPARNLAPGFDFTDSDGYVDGLPMAEFAELRASASIWWNQQASLRGGCVRGHG
jgi:hypothetical protein